MKRQHTFDFTIRWIESWYNTRKNFKFLDKVTTLQFLVYIHIQFLNNWNTEGENRNRRDLEEVEFSPLIEFPWYLPNFSIGDPREYFPTTVNNGRGWRGGGNEIIRANKFPLFLPSSSQIFHSITDLMANRFNCIHGERIIDFSRFLLFNPPSPSFSSP